MDPVALTLDQVVRFAVVLFRVAGVMVFAPFFSARAIPYQVRISFAFVTTIALIPSAPVGQIPSGVGLGWILGCILGEVFFGMVLGLVASFVFAGMQLAGQIIAFQLGFSLINLIDPQSEVETTVISFLENYLGILFFLLLNAHHWFFLAISESFSYMPAQGVHLQGPVVQEVIRLSSQILVTGVRIAAPVVAVTVIADVVLGIVGRVAPQVSVLIVGMPLKTLVGFACLSISFYFLPRLFGAAYTRLFHDLFALARRMA